MPRNRPLALVALLGLLGAVSPTKGDDPPADLKRMEGKWTSKDESGAEATWTFKGDRLSLEAPGRKYEVKIKLDPAGKPETHIDFEVLEESPNSAGYKAPGIYRFDGEDKLKICFGDEASGRPTEYKTDFGKSFAFELERKKPDEAKKP